MRPASVGFQCPNCVKEGARTTRSGLAPYGGRRIGNPQATTIGLIVANVLVWIAVLADGGDGGSLYQKLVLLPQTTTFQFDDGTIHFIEGVSGGAYWQLVSSVFTHVQVTHIGFNMLALFFLGPQLELVLGRARFLALYFLSGLTGSLAVMWLAGAHTQTLGASGAVFGLLGALLVVALKVGSDTQQILLWLGINVVFTFVARGSVSWQGHLGGFLGGALVAALIVYAPRQRRGVVQWAGMAGILALTLGLIAVRASALA